MHNKKNNTSKSQNFIQGLRPFSNSIPYGLKKILKKGGYNFATIVDNWTKMVGNEISKSCYPIKIKTSREMSNGTLIVNVIHGKELEIEYCKKEIIDKINGFFGYDYINEIKLKIVHEKKIKREFINKKKMKNNFEKKLNMIQNDNLKSSLDRLIKAYNLKND
jgi:hypothetical protein